LPPKEEELLKREKNAKYVTGDGKTCSETPSIHDLTPTVMTDREITAGSRWRDKWTTDGVERVTSRAKTRSTRPTAGDDVGTAATRAAGSGRDEAQSHSTMIWQRRPSD